MTRAAPRTLRLALLTGAAVVTLLSSTLIPSEAAVQGSWAGASSVKAPLRNAQDRTSDFNGDGYADLAIGAPDEDVSEASNAGAVHVLYGSPTSPHILVSDDDQRWTQNSDGVKGVAEEGDRFGWALAFGDFDYDGNDDLAIGVKGEDLEGAAGAGAVAVLYGSSTGLTSAGNQLFTQDSEGIRGDAEEGDNFGYALAAADFGDVCGGEVGREDLAIGVRNEDLGLEKENAGAVNVIYGDVGGLDSCGNQIFTQDTGEGFSEIDGVAEADDRFGSSLAAGDFDWFGFDDLAIGVPEEDLGDAIDAGGINEIRSYAGFLVSVYDDFWSQNKAEMADDAETGDLFGFALASTNFVEAYYDGWDDLVVGVPGEDGSEGAVHALWSDESGVSDRGYFIVQQTEEAGAEFGSAVTAGSIEISGGSVPILAIGAPGADVEGIGDAGSVTVLYWSDGMPGDPTVWTQDSTDIEDAAETGDAFGSALTLAITNGTYETMLAIGVPLEDVDSIADSGAVNVLYGDRVGYAATDDQHWTQATDGVNGVAEADDAFGSAVA